MISTDLFVVPHEADRYLLYAPLKQWALLVNQDLVNLLATLERGERPARGARDETATRFLDLLRDMEILDGPPDPALVPGADGVDRAGEFAPTSATLFLTTDCNLRCAYCYASAGDAPRTMSWPVARAAVDEIVRNATGQDAGVVTLSFHGGGEPTLSWKLFTRTVEYAKAQADHHGVALRVTTATNGILSEKQVEWLIAHLTEINVSFDGPPRVQDRQRPTRNGQGSFDLVARTLDRLDAAGFPYGIRATVTRQSLEALSDLVLLVADRWPHCESLHVEPAFHCGRCVTDGVEPPEDREFVTGYRRAWTVALARGVDLFYSGVRLGTLTNVFCRAAGDSFCVTPEGQVTSCFEVSDAGDPRADLFFYGRYEPDESRFIFDRARIARLRALIVNNRAYCADCFIKWHCAGDCAAKVLLDFQAYDDAPGGFRCWVNQTLSKDLIIHSYGSGALPEPSEGESS